MSVRLNDIKPAPQAIFAKLISGSNAKGGKTSCPLLPPIGLASEIKFQETLQHSSIRKTYLSIGKVGLYLSFEIKRRRYQHLIPLPLAV